MGDRPYLIDAGSSASRRLGQAGISPRSLNGVFVTHMHSDHIAELFTLFWLNVTEYQVRRPERLTPVYGPPTVPGAPHADVSGIKAVLDALRTAAAHEFDVRNAEAARPID